MCWNRSLQSVDKQSNKGIGFRSQAGMTLIEVLVAMFILAITLVAAMKTTATATTNQIILRERLLAEWVGRNTLAERRLGLTPWQDSGELNGEATMGGKSFVWKQTITYVPGANRDFRLIELTVSPQGEPKKILFRAIDFVRRPL